MNDDPYNGGQDNGDDGYFDSNLTSGQNIENAFYRSGADLENPEEFKGFMKKVKEMYSSMRLVMNQVVKHSQKLKSSGVSYSKNKVFEEQLGTGELNMGVQIAVAAPARQAEKFDPQVPTRKGGGGQGR